MSPILQVFGRLHPLLLHLPIGLLFGALLLELLTSMGMLQRRAFALYLWGAALSACLTASAGWVLGHEEGYDAATLERHEQLGIALAALALVAALLHDPSGRSRLRLGLARACLLASCAFLLPAGHLGSTLTHGDDWLDGPRPRALEVVPVTAQVSGDMAATVGAPDSAAPSPVAQPETYAEVVAPIFAERCARCHGAKKHKGGLRLDSPAGLLAGGEDGPVLVPGDVAASPLLLRARLPLEHEDHMPPEGKPQPTAAELAALESWVAAGAPFGSASRAAPAAAPIAEATPVDAPTKTEGAKAHAEAANVQRVAALAALDAAFVHHEPVQAGANGLVLDVAAVAPSFGDAELERLVVPLAADVVELVLARSAVDDAALSSIARFPALVRLDLRATQVTDAGLAALAGHATLAELVLAQTKLSDASVDVLLGLPQLAKVALWNSGVSPAGLARLRARAGLVVNAGDEPPAEPLESEGELAFSSERALPGAELGPESLRPINATCPVSGSPVNPKYAVLHEGRVIGFCCPNCPKEFWTDPAKFAAKLP